MLAPNWTPLEFRLEDCVNLAGWRALRRKCLVPAGLNAPELMLEARQLTGGQFATVRNAGELLLVLPVTRRPIAASGWAALQSPISFSGIPHVDADLAGPALEMLVEKMDAPILLRAVPLDGPFMDALAESGARTKVLERWQRATLEISGSYEDWFESAFERKRRKEYRRLKARLAERGSFEECELRAGDDPSDWMDSFLGLEAAGWKGRRGTAVDADTKAADALRAALAALHRAGHLRFWSIRIDGRTIAALYAIVERDRAWLGKIAYDESFARFSPGALLVLHATERLFAEGTIVHADSCAIPGHPMIDRIWRDRIAVGDVLIAPLATGAVKLAMLVATEMAWCKARAALRKPYHALTGRHRS